MISKAQLLAGYTDADRDANGNQQALDITGLTATDADGNVVGSFALSAEQDRWTFTPNDYFNGTVNLNYNVTDGTASTAASNSFELASVNDAPELTGVQAVLANGTEDLEYTIKVSDLLAGYTDADNDPIEVFGITSTAGLLTLNSEGDAYTFKPNENISGDVTFDYVVRDKFGGNTIATINLSLDAVNDKPIRTGGNFNTLYLQEDQDPTAIGLQDLNYNPGGGASRSNQGLKYALTTLPDSSLGQIGSLSTDTDGNSVFTAITEAGDISLEQLRQLVFNPAAEASGNVSFNFSVTDQGKQPKITDIRADQHPVVEHDASYKSKSVAPMSGPSLPLQMMPMASGTGMTSKGFRSPRIADDEFLTGIYWNNRDGGDIGAIQQIGFDIYNATTDTT